MLIPLQHICDNYEDSDLWLVAADQYHDAEQYGIEAALRWVVKYGKRPYKLPRDLRIGPIQWVWFDPEHGGSSYYHVRRHLDEFAPDSCKLPRFLMGYSDYFNGYGLPSTAMQSLVGRYAGVWGAIQ